MGKSSLLVLLSFGFTLLDTVSTFPIDISSLGAEPNGLWLTYYFLTGAGFLLAVIGVLFSCICCRNSKGFKEFSNSSGSLATSHFDGFASPESNSELTIFPPNTGNCRFEPLPDIKVQAPNLRPAAFSYSEREISSQDWFANPYNNFPRNQLKYVQEYGRGWFGRVVEGEAQNIMPKEKLTKVMVKILHEDATPTDQMYFLHEVKFYRDLKHPNILRLLGRCLETEPFLIILECYPNGDLKTFLSQNLASAQALAEQGVTLQMCSNITSGLQFMHENKFIHTDLAARNCLVGPNLSVKIGDYGNSIEIFKSDYYCAGSVALPVRWCAPETLKCTDVTIETREVTQPANIWSLAVVFWEICEFCKLPYAELNDDQVIVRVLGEKNYFLEKPNMFCLHKDELYHLMKLCWNPPLQRPTASQIYAILNNLVLSNKATQKDALEDSKQISQDFEQRWQNFKPNYIPKKDNDMEVEQSPNRNIISSKLKNAKIADSSLLDSHLKVFMSNESPGQKSPRLCLKSDLSNLSETEEYFNETDQKINKTNNHNLKDDESLIAESACPVNSKTLENKIDCENIAEEKTLEIFKSNFKFKEDAPDVDSWLKGVEINNEEDECFVRKISEAIRDLDATLALEKTSSSEEASGKSSHQNSPGKDSKENEIVIDFKLGRDTSSFINFTQKSFELSSLQNTEQPQSLDFTDPYFPEKKIDFEESFGPNSLMSSVMEESNNKFHIKSDVFDESLKEHDSLICGQSRNSSDTDDEIWRKRIEKGEISEKVKEKSKSIANLMILTHIDASDESDIDLDKPFDKGFNRNSFLRRSGSFGKSISSNNFGSENDLTHAVLEDDFKESLKKLSNDHKEYGHFDSLGMILPTSARRDSVWENFFKSDPLTENFFDKPSTSQSDLNFKEEESEKKNKFQNDSLPKEDDKPKYKNSNNFLGNVASEKINSTTSKVNEDNFFLIENSEIKNNNDSTVGVVKKVLSESEESVCKSACNNSSSKNSSPCKVENSVNLVTFTKNDILPFQEDLSNEKSDPSLVKKEIQDSENNLINSNDRKLIINKNKDINEQKINIEETLCIDNALKNDCYLVNEIIDSEENSKEIFKLSDKTSKNGFPNIPTIIMSKAEEEPVLIDEIEKDSVLTNFKCKPFKFVFKGQAPQITMTEGSEVEAKKKEEENPESFEFVLNESEDFSKDSLKKAKPSDNIDKSSSSIPPPALDPFIKNIEENFVPNHRSNVVIGACEEYTLDYFKGLKTNSENIKIKENEKIFQDILKEMGKKEVNLDIWDKHLENAFSQQLRDADFNDVNFKSFNLEFCETDNQEEQSNFTELVDSKTCPVKTIVDFIDFEKNHTENVENKFFINTPSNLTEMENEEYYENFKLRTPDDERSSDSGFRDKGSLSESVEDAFEGKYNLEDIEAELEEAFSKGTFGNCETEKEVEDVSKKSSEKCNFEYEESKFYEDESKNEEDFSDIDGEIEFWQNKDNSDYYPEISEFNPSCSQSWYLHPPDESSFSNCRNLNEDLVNALRQELQETLPVQSRSFDEFNNFYESGVCDVKRELNIHYLNDFGIPLSPIIEEQDYLLKEISRKNIKNSLLSSASHKKVRDNVANIMESVKSIDTNTFKQYLDYMIENEGRDLEDIDEMCEDINEAEVNFLQPSNNNTINKCVEEENTNDNNVSLTDTTKVSIKKLEPNNSTIAMENLKSDILMDVIQAPKKNDALLVNVDSNEVSLSEKLDLETCNTFLDSLEPKGDLDIIADNSENEGLVFTPEMLSPDRERSLSEISRSSIGTRTGDALSDITMSSPDLIPDCFSVSAQETVQNIESNETLKESKNNKIFSKDEVVNKDVSMEEIDHIIPNILSEPFIHNKLFFINKENPILEPLEKNSNLQKNLEIKDFSENQVNSLKIDIQPENNDSFEMTTSFMGYEDEINPLQLDGEVIEKDNKELEKEIVVEDSYSGDWESESSEGEEMSSSSGEFIWKDGDKESKVKAIQATHCDVKCALSEKFQNIQSVNEISTNTSCLKEKIDKEGLKNVDEDFDDDNESSTGSSASITDFVPSAWNSQAIPSRSVLRSPHKKVDDQPKKNVWFKKQKYHCVYEYPREPSDNEDGETLNHEKRTSDSPNKHFIFGVNTVELPNKHFPYGISNVIDYSNFTDWDILEGDEDVSLTDSESENGLGKTDSNAKKENNLNFYNLSPFDSDFNSTGSLNDESEFFVSSSSRPFQISPSNQFFSGHDEIFQTNAEDINGLGNHEIRSKDFLTPDSGLEDSTTDTPINKKLGLGQPDLLFFMENPSDNKSEIINLFDDLKSNCTTDIKETNNKKIDLEEYGANTNSLQNRIIKDNSNGLSTPLSFTGLGELRHTKDKLKLELPHNHNVELEAVINKNNHNSLKLSN